MDNEILEQANWYVVHTYSGHENKVKSKIENMIENGKAQNVFDVRVPMEEYEDTKKGGEKVLKERKIFPGYVLIKMIVDPKNWYLIRNTRGVTGFIGPDGQPIPLSQREIRDFGIEKDEVLQLGEGNIQLDLEVGDEFEISAGAFEGSIGKVESINHEKQLIKTVLDIMGRDTTVEVPFEYIKQ